MSIFDQYENFLPRDKKPRKIKSDSLEYQNLGDQTNENFEEKDIEITKNRIKTQEQLASWPTALKHSQTSEIQFWLLFVYS